MPTPELSVSIDVSALPDQRGGVERYVSHLLQALGAGNDAGLTAFARRGDDRWAALAPDAHVRREAPGSRAQRLLWEQTALPLRLRGLRPDVHHGPHYTMPYVSGVPSVVTIHDLTFVTHPEWHERVKVAYFGRAIALAARRADVLVCVSARTAAALQERYRVRGRVVTAPHGVEHAQFQPLDGDGSDRARLGSLGVDGPYVLFLGTVEPRKNVPGLIRAFARVAGDHPEVSLVIAGGAGWDEERVTEEIARSPVRSRIRRLGWVPEAALPALLRAAAVVAYPSLEEGFGLPVLEALACGAPVITTRDTVMEDVSDGAAILVTAGDDGDLAAALDGVLDTGEDRQRRVRGLEVAGRYTWEASAAVHLDAYRLAAGRPTS